MVFFICEGFFQVQLEQNKNVKRFRAVSFASVGWIKFVKVKDTFCDAFCLKMHPSQKCEWTPTFEQEIATKPRRIYDPQICLVAFTRFVNIPSCPVWYLAGNVHPLYLTSTPHTWDLVPSETWCPVAMASWDPCVAMEADDERIGGYLGDSMGEQLPVTVTTSPLVAPQISSIAASSDANAEIPVEADRSSASRPISRARFLWVLGDLDRW